MLQTTGMHFATTAMCQLTCGLDQLVRLAPYPIHKSVKLLVRIWLEYARSVVQAWTYVEVMRL